MSVSTRYFGGQRLPRAYPIALALPFLYTFSRARYVSIMSMFSVLGLP